jgi:hypothetical protein
MGITKEYDETKNNVEEGLKAVTAQKEKPVLQTWERIQLVAPDLSSADLKWLTTELETFENTIGMTILDPKQVEKFVSEMLKARDRNPEGSVTLEERVHTDETLSFKTVKGDEDQKSQADKIESALETIACATHMANRAYCIALGDNSQPLWEDAPDWQQSSAKNGVRAILKNPDTTPEQSHEGWLKQKTEEGWKYGAVKDPEKKEHPCFLPYAELPEAQRVKDAIFGATVRSMAKVHGSL